MAHVVWNVGQGLGFRVFSLFVTTCLAYFGRPPLFLKYDIPNFFCFLLTAGRILCFQSKTGSRLFDRMVFGTAIGFIRRA
ncbi:hypothetical protein IWZ03DRAFT_140319 [Phyllosticta citriasiana]|uniref:Secreted protein n=1 Tax=Phyllosticta citriasiana TaxID=595635 RepID=A0ABR1KU12_9PEZI